MKTTLEELQLIKLEGFETRRIVIPDDMPAMLDLFHRSNEVDKIEEIETLEALTNHYHNLRNCDVKKDSLIVENDGQLVCVARVWWSEESEGNYIYSMFANVHPDWRGRGIGFQVQKWLELRAKEISFGHDPEKPKFLSVWGQETQEDKFNLIESFGFTEERYFFEMTRELSAPIPDPVLPENIEVRPVTPEHFRKIWDASNEAFRDHWGHVEAEEKDYKRWLKRIEELPEYNPELWKVAWEGDEVVGMVLNAIFEEENEKLNVKKGWTDPICVRRAWRKIGIATALIYDSMQMFKEMGMEQAALGVDTHNPSGALNLYTNCGFEPGYKWVVFRKPLN